MQIGGSELSLRLKKKHLDRDGTKKLDSAGEIRRELLGIDLRTLSTN